MSTERFKLHALLLSLCVSGLLVPTTASSTPRPASLPHSASDESAQLSQAAFEPPPRQGSPSRTASGGSRDGSQCAQDSGAGFPLATLGAAEAVEITTDSRPTFRVQIPKTSAQSAELSLFDANGAGVYQTSLSLTNTPTIASVKLPDTAPALQPNQDYYWIFAVICTPGDRLQDRWVSGSIRYVETSASRLSD